MNLLDWHRPQSHTTFDNPNMLPHGIRCPGFLLGCSVESQCGLLFTVDSSTVYWFPSRFQHGLVCFLCSKAILSHSRNHCAG